MLDLLLPQRCLGCSLPGRHVCDGCASNLSRIGPPLCARCGAPTAWPVRRCSECTGRRLAFASARAAVAYDEPVRRIVTAWKERGLRRLARWAAETTAAAVERPAADCIAFVPADRDRRLKRGDHAAQSLAHELGRLWELPVEELLHRTRPSSRQRGLTRLERRRNVARAFRSHRSPSRILLVDDVYTTGATVNAAASALRKEGARTVAVVTFARAIRLR